MAMSCLSYVEGWQPRAGKETVRPRSCYSSTSSPPPERNVDAPANLRQQHCQRTRRQRGYSKLYSAQSHWAICAAQEMLKVTCLTGATESGSAGWSRHEGAVG